MSRNIPSRRPRSVVPSSASPTRGESPKSPPRVSRLSPQTSPQMSPRRIPRTVSRAIPQRSGGNNDVKVVFGDDAGLENKIVELAYSLYDLPRGTYEKYWNVTQILGNIALINYNESKISEYLKSKDNENFTNDQLSNLLNIRGCGFDFVEKRKVYHSYGYTPVINIDYIPQEGIFGVTTDGIAINIPNDENMVLKPIYDGTLIHVYKHAGKVYTSTKRSINIENSRFGKSENFGKLFRRFFNIDSNDELDGKMFDKTKDYSDFVHVFLLNDPYLQINTRYDVGVGSLKYLKTFRLQGEGFQDDNVETTSEWLETFTLYESPFVPPAPKEFEPIVYNPAVLDIEKANKVLRSGYYTVNESDFFSRYGNPKINDELDIRILPGESIICEYGSDDARNIIRLTPSSNQWRIDVLDNKNNNLFYQYVRLTDFVYAFKNEKDMTANHKYQKLFPNLVPGKNDETHKLKNITTCFNLAVPYAETQNSSQYFVTYSNYMNRLIIFLTENFNRYLKLFQIKNLQSLKELSNDDGGLNTQGKTINSIFIEIEKNYKNGEESISSVLTRIPGKYIYSLFKLIDTSLQENN